MKQIKTINNSLRIERTVMKRLTTIWIYVGEEKEKLFEMQTSDTFWLNYVHDENYIVVYSRGCMVNNLPLTIEIVYDIKKNEIITLSKEKEIIFNYVYISRRGFNTSVILQYLNNNDLEITSLEELDFFEKYITGRKCNVSKENIINYVIKQYPILKKYVNIDIPLSVNKYQKIIENIGTGTLWFHMMPQALN